MSLSVQLTCIVRHHLCAYNVCSTIIKLNKKQNIINALAVNSMHHLLAVTMIVRSFVCVIWFACLSLHMQHIPTYQSIHSQSFENYIVYILISVRKQTLLAIFAKQIHFSRMLICSRAFFSFFFFFFVLKRIHGPANDLTVPRIAVFMYTKKVQNNRKYSLL